MTEMTITAEFLSGRSRESFFSFSLILMLFFVFNESVQAFELTAYPNSRQELSERETKENHPVIINLMKKVNGIVTSDDAQWLKGDLERALFLMPQGHDSLSAFDFFLNQFLSAGVSERYSCKSFSCGGSNFWANDVFDIARLYGQDRYQAYFIGEKAGDYFSVYTVRRGNGRVYALVDMFKPAVHRQAVTGLKLSEQLLNHESANIYLSNKASLMAVDPSFQELGALLISNPSLRVVLIIQGIMPATLNEYDQLEIDLKQYRNILLERLVSEGVKPRQIRLTSNIEHLVQTSKLPEGKIQLRIVKLP